MFLGSGVVPFCPFYFGVHLLKPNTRKKGTLIIKGLLRNLGSLVKMWLGGMCAVLTLQVSVLG